MVRPRTCRSVTNGGEPCGAPPLRDGDVCFWHSPEHAQEVADARRLGGLRRRREGTLSGVYDVGDFESVAAIRRIVEIVTYDALGMENSVARGRLLLAAAQIAAKLLEVGELERRLEDVEAAVRTRPAMKGKRR